MKKLAVFMALAALACMPLRAEFIYGMKIDGAKLLAAPQIKALMTEFDQAQQSTGGQTIEQMLSENSLTMKNLEGTFEAFATVAQDDTATQEDKSGTLVLFKSEGIAKLAVDELEKQKAEGKIGDYTVTERDGVKVYELSGDRVNRLAVIDDNTVQFSDVLELPYNIESIPAEVRPQSDSLISVSWVIPAVARETSPDTPASVMANLVGGDPNMKVSAHVAFEGEEAATKALGSFNAFKAETTQGNPQEMVFVPVAAINAINAVQNGKDIMFELELTPEVIKDINRVIIPMIALGIAENGMLVGETEEVLLDENGNPVAEAEDVVIVDPKNNAIEEGTVVAE